MPSCSCLVTLNSCRRTCIYGKQAASGRPDINLEIHPEDNRYLIVHECSGFGPGDGEISFHIGPIRAVQMLNDYMLFGRESIPHILDFLFG